jgi:uncharacterized protein (DUF1330 family)
MIRRSFHAALCVTLGIAIGVIAARSFTPSQAADDAHVAAASPCASPVYLIGVLHTRDADKMKSYGDALFASGIVAANGGRYVARARPFQVLEGAWPQNRSIVVAEYPCAAAARRFWFSETYQEIRKRREGASDLWVALFDRAATP